MKTKAIILLVVFSCVSLGMFAQRGEKGQRGEKRQPDKARTEKMKAAMVGRISNQLNLTAQEAEKFWPVYNEMQAKNQELGKALREEMSNLRKAKKEGQSFSDAEYKKMISLNLNHKVKAAELRKSYFEKIEKILPAEKAFKLENLKMQARGSKMAFKGRQAHRGKMMFNGRPAPGAKMPFMNRIKQVFEKDSKD